MEITEITHGGIDLHTHSNPSIFPRRLNDWEMIAEAKERGLGGIVIKSHESSTVDRAQVLQMAEHNLQIYGGIVLNYFVGGLNPYAVDAALKMGGKFVWLPTISSEQHIKHYRGKEGRLFQGIGDLLHPTEGITIIDENKKLKSEIYDIIDLVKKYNAVLCTGHISSEEVEILSEAVFERKLPKYLITHPDMGISPIPLETQICLAKKGAYLEKCYLATTAEFNDLTVQEMAETIKQIGPSQCALVTDFGQSFNVSPLEAMENFINQLLKTGLTTEEIRVMYVDLPNQLVKG